MSKNKKQSELEHFKRRLRERYDIHLSDNQIRELRKKIGTKECILVTKQSRRTRKYLIQINDKSIPVIYDINRKMFVTALPKL